jgi:MFS family permease
LSSAELGLLLLSIAVGSIIGLPMAGLVIQRLGSSRTVAATSILVSVSVAIFAVGYLFGTVPVVIGLFLTGLGYGAWDVAMNVQGAVVERHLGRAIMPRFHAGFSVGTVAGALLGVLMVAVDAPVTAHLLVVAVAVGVAVPLAVRRFVSDTDSNTEADEESASTVDGEQRPRERSHALKRWREPRTVLIGICILAFAFAEGVGNDWISVALIDGYGASAVVGTLGFTAFLAAMTIARWVGPGLLDRYGRVVVIRVLSAVTVVGLLLFVFSPNVALAFVGALLWGMGASLGFPVGMSAAADDPAAAASRVSVVASIGYCAFLAGPPLIGFLGESITVLKALTSVAVLVALAALIAGALRPLTTPTIETTAAADYREPGMEQAHTSASPDS